MGSESWKAERRRVMNDNITLRERVGALHDLAELLMEELREARDEGSHTFRGVVVESRRWADEEGLWHHVDLLERADGSLVDMEQVADTNPIVSHSRLVLSLRPRPVRERHEDDDGDGDEQITYGTRTRQGRSS